MPITARPKDRLARRDFNRGHAGPRFGRKRRCVGKVLRGRGCLAGRAQRRWGTLFLEVRRIYLHPPRCPALRQTEIRCASGVSMPHA